jgi:hypothetical protein
MRHSLAATDSENRLLTRQGDNTPDAMSQSSSLRRTAPESLLRELSSVSIVIYMIEEKLSVSPWPDTETVLLIVLLTSNTAAILQVNFPVLEAVQKRLSEICNKTVLRSAFNH